MAGPALAGYVLWVLERSFEMGLKRLYFISRDGEIMLEMAQRLLPAFWPDATMELRYLGLAPGLDAAFVPRLEA